MKTPKVFISYSWSSEEHQKQILEYAERLMSDGVEVIIDLWELKEGQDKYAFMEKMVTDESISHVLVFSDEGYTEKADSRKAGVGTESQIISKEIYDKVEQKKFLPVVCECHEDGKPYLPVFLRSRIYFDFSTPEAKNNNWEKLIRSLFGKPLHEKPEVGKPPSYLDGDKARQALPTIGKLAALKSALLNGRPGVENYRDDFLHAAIGFADNLRVREEPHVDYFDEIVVNCLHTLLPLRDQLLDWLSIEIGSGTSEKQIGAIIIELLEELIALKYRPKDIYSFNRKWFDAQGVFAYEMFVYVVALLLKKKLYSVIKVLFEYSYLVPETAFDYTTDFVHFTEFYFYSDVLEGRYRRLALNKKNPLANFLHERTSPNGLSFGEFMQAELLIFLKSLLLNDRLWFPQSLIYSSEYRRFPFFARAARRGDYRVLASIISTGNADDLRAYCETAFKENKVSRWDIIRFGTSEHLWQLMNLEKLATID